MQGFGTELGLINLFLYAMAAGVAAMAASKLKILLQLDLAKMSRRHKLMWAHYVKEHLEDSGDIADLMDD